MSEQFENFRKQREKLIKKMQSDYPKNPIQNNQNTQPQNNQISERSGIINVNTKISNNSGCNTCKRNK